MKRTPRDLKNLRHLRMRQKLKGTAARPRLCVNRTLKHVHAQIIDDSAGRTLAAVSTVQTDVASQVEGGTGSKAAARVVGTMLAQKAKEQGVEAVVFDRNGNLYHGVVRELAEAAREGGLQF